MPSSRSSKRGVHPRFSTGRRSKDTYVDTDARTMSMTLTTNHHPGVAAALCFGIVGCTFAAQQATLDELSQSALARIEGEVAAPRLHADVRVTRDKWGVPHIQAESDEDLFF